jgi:NADPH:quinone reductase-like Zn-dependent oxidoreductase
MAGKDALCDRYGLLGEDRDGGYAERVAVPARNLFPIPRGLSFVEASAIPLVFLTAWHMLVDRAQLRPQETVLVQAAGSGVSTAAIQISKLLGASQIFAASTTPEKRTRALELGATATIDSSNPDFWREVRSKTGGRGVDVVVDHVGGELFEKSLRCLARGGRIVFCGATGGGEVRLPLRQLFFKSQSILGSTMGSNHELATLLGFFDRGLLRPVVAKSFPWTEAAEAQALLESRAVFGKIVLAVGSAAHSQPKAFEMESSS